MEIALNSLFDSKDLRAEIFTSNGNIYNLHNNKSKINYYVNDDFKNFLNQTFDSETLKKILSENVLKIKNKDKIIWESGFKHKRNHIPILNIISVKSPEGYYFNLNLNKTDNTIEVEDYDSEASVDSKFNEDVTVDVKKWNYSNDTFNFIICCIICLFLKSGAKVETNTIIKSSDSNFVINESKKIYEFTKYCGCDNKLPQKNKKIEFCKYSRTKIENMINELENIEYPVFKEKFTDLTLKIWDLFYMYTSSNRSFDLNVYINRYLSDYLSFCNVGELIIDYVNYTIQGPSPKQLINKLKSCKNKAIVNLKIMVNNNSHANILIIENGEVWKYEPNESVGFKQKNMEKYVDKALTEYFKESSLIYQGLHEDSCGINHIGLCKFISYFKIIYGNNLTDNILKESIIKFFRWLIKRICSNFLFLNKPQTA